MRIDQQPPVAFFQRNTVYEAESDNIVFCLPKCSHCCYAPTGVSPFRGSFGTKFTGLSQIKGPLQIVGSSQLSFYETFLGCICRPISSLCPQIGENPPPFCPSQSWDTPASCGRKRPTSLSFLHGRRTTPKRRTVWVWARFLLAQGLG